MMADASSIVLSPSEASPGLDPVTALIKLKRGIPKLGACVLANMVNVDPSLRFKGDGGLKRCFEPCLTGTCPIADSGSSALPHKKRKLSLLKTITSEEPLLLSPSAIASSPKNVFLEILRQGGFDARFRTARSLQEQGGYFLDMCESNIASYQGETVTALREKNMPRLREITEANPAYGLQCCNQFGESLIHMSCRRGYTEVTKFLLTEGKVNVRVTDDYGRTPLHDACWTTVPNEEMMKFLFTEAHDLLLVKDSRGHTPLDYVSRRHWKQWIEFLKANETSLVPNCQMKKYFSSKP